MKKITFLLSISIFLYMNISFSQDYVNIGISTISSNELKEHVAFMCNDVCAGRGTGQTGIDTAALYISNEFEKLGILPYCDSTYYQAFNLFSKTLKQADIKYNNKTYKNFNQIFYNYSVPTTINEAYELIFIGNGTDDEVKNMDLENKVVLVFMENMRNAFSIKKKLAKKGVKAFLITNPYNKKQYKALENQRKRISQRKHLSRSKNLGNNYYSSYYRLPEIIIHEDLIKEFTGKKTKELLKLIEKTKKSKKSDHYNNLKLKNITINFSIVPEPVVCNNVVGYIEGSKQKNDFILIGAHYDHLGKKGNNIYYGADDNASGTCGVLEIAEAFSELKKQGYTPKKSVIFAAFTAEELGLIGSKHFVNELINDKKRKVSVALNLDMIGRLDTTDNSGQDYVALLSSKKYIDNFVALSDSLKSADFKYQLKKQYSFGGSDHQPFIDQNIPALMFFTGLHKDYHAPSDTPEKINYESYKQIVQHILKMALHYAF